MKFRLSYLLLTGLCFIASLASFSFDSAYIPTENLMISFLNTPEKINNFIKTHNEAAEKAKKTVNVTVIGAGPGGLTSALRAYLAGANVVLVEKRDRYYRQQVLGLEVKNLKALVQTEFLNIPEGSISIQFELNRLEELLYSVVKDLAQKDSQNMKVLYGYELKEPSPEQGKSTVTVASKNNSIDIPTNILIGADSIHSAVRKLAGINELIITNEVPVMIAVFKNPNPENTNMLKDERDEARDQATMAAKKENNQAKIAILDAQYDKELFYHNDRLIYLGMQLTEEQFKKFQAAKDKTPVAKELINESVFGPEFFKDLEMADPIGPVKYPSAFKLDLRKAVDTAAVKDDMLIALIGDAAGTTHFFTGTGANRAIEDSVAVGELVQAYLAQEAPNLNDLAKDFNEKTAASVCRMQKEVLETGLGIDEKLKALEKPGLTPSSADLLAAATIKQNLLRQKRSVSKVKIELEKEQTLIRQKTPELICIPEKK